MAVGETLRVDTGCLVAFATTVDYDIQFVGGFKNALFGGEGLFFTRMTGPGRVYLQSLPFSRVVDRIKRGIPFSQSGGEKKRRGWHRWGCFQEYYQWKLIWIV